MIQVMTSANHWSIVSFILDMQMQLVNFGVILDKLMSMFCVICLIFVMFIYNLLLVLDVLHSMLYQD